MLGYKSIWGLQIVNGVYVFLFFEIKIKCIIFYLLFIQVVQAFLFLPRSSSAGLKQQSCNATRKASAKKGERGKRCDASGFFVSSFTIILFNVIVFFSLTF